MPSVSILNHNFTITWKFISKSKQGLFYANGKWFATIAYDHNPQPESLDRMGARLFHARLGLNYTPSN